MIGGSSLLRVPLPHVLLEGFYDATPCTFIYELSYTRCSAHVTLRTYISISSSGGAQIILYAYMGRRPVIGGKARIEMMPSTRRPDANKLIESWRRRRRRRLQTLHI
ncbi:unnamed protein product [Trichogramma brassicae]|uniref:Uncharacterized protein n=1 Tax=Trichogramma brassicae TaxID=86971 RepID=A0A6H5J1Q2_9HYME|nr:unnamed protein product [Trichogramma brassicae]